MYEQVLFCICHSDRLTEPVFVNLLRSPEIDPIPQYWRADTTTCLSYNRPARLHRLTDSIPRIRFPGSINVYNYSLCTVTAADNVTPNPS